MAMTFPERLQKFNSDRTCLEKELMPYWRVVGPRCESVHITPNHVPDSIEIGDGLVIFHYEYSDSCSCHPEMQDAEIALSFSSLGLTPEELEATYVRVEKQRREALKKEEDERLADEAAAALARQAKKEQDEHTEYLRLKQKFGE